MSSLVLALLLIAAGAVGSLGTMLHWRKRLGALKLKGERLERLEMAVLAAKVGIWEWQLDTGVMQWDDQMLRLYGITRADFTGDVSSWQRALHPDDRERANVVLQSALRGEKPFELQFKVIHFNGEIRTLQAHGWVKRDALGKPIVMYGMNRDITEELKIREHLEEMNAYFQAAMNQTHLGIVIANAPSGEIRFANEAATEIGQIPRDQLLKDSHFGNYDRWLLADLDGHPVSSDELPLTRSIRFGERVSRALTFTHPDGKKRYILANSSPIRRADGTIMAGIVITLDTTEEHRLMDELKQAREKAEVASTAKSRFLDIAAHELRTPVTAFSLLLQLSQKRLQEGHPVEAPVLSRLRSHADRLSRLVVDLLEVSRLDRGVMLLKRKQLDVGKLISECLSSFALQDPSRSFEIHLTPQPVLAEIDPVRIYEVISNLIDNAIKYTPSERPIRIDLAETHDSFAVSVRDHGHGVPDSQRADLFKAFERGSSDVVQKHAGLGLGLYISRKIVELHGGQITVETIPENGMRFRFEIPKKTTSTQVKAA